ncbi:MAG TPA: sodium:solute symporter [Bryobacteraceae bacterium]|nr:sodium:solute symporter [Bryobacteraceae bacterium]
MTAHAADLAVIAAYLLGITWFGARFRKSQHGLKDYFLGGRNAPWWAIALSIVSAETSTLTVIGTPALAFAGDFGFLQVVLGYLFARIVISTLFLPHYFRGEMFTAYELMRRRFGEHVRRYTAATFLILRALAEGVRVFALSIVVSIVLAPLYARFGASVWAEAGSIFVILCLTLFYTFEGGLTAVIWTDVVQMILYVGGALVSFLVLLQHIPGGWSHAVAGAAAAGKFRVFDFRFSFSSEFFSRPYSFWAGVIGGCFLTTASHGTEQLMVQRLLAARNERESRTALFASWAVILFQFTLFLIIGAFLFVWYGDTHRPAPHPPDRIYPDFVWHFLPAGIAGLVIAAILAAGMSNLSAALNALASTSIMDFYKPLFAPHASDENRLMTLARRATLLWGAVLFAIALIARNVKSVLEAGLSVASVLYGALLGAFLLGLLTRRVGGNAAMIAMTTSLITMLLVNRFTHIAFTWYVVLGTAVTFICGLAASLVLPREEAA